MCKENESVEINIPIFELLLAIGIILTIVGTTMFMGIKYINILGGIYIDTHLWIVLLPLGVGLICGYITRKILHNQKGSYVLGLVLGVIGLIIAICTKLITSNNKYEELQRLEELKQNGTITEAEFKLEKSKILKGE